MEHGAPVEVEKNESEKGGYQHPELYGQSAVKGMNYRPSPAVSPAPSANE